MLFAPRSGVLLHIDHPRLVDLARRADVRRSVDVAGDAGRRTIEAVAQTGKAVMETLERVGDKSRDALRSAASPTSRATKSLQVKARTGPMPWLHLAEP
jgi:hypothetical protein